MLIPQISRIEVRITESEIEAFLLEANLIKKYKPKYNVKLTDGKLYLAVRITVNDSFPAVLTARKQDDNPSADGSLYFGPFPNASGALRMVLRTIRRIFPYSSSRNHGKKICLSHHLGLCPCPPVYDSKEAKYEYKKTIKHVIDFLNGNTRKIIKDLEKERNILSKGEKFEKANILQGKINAIKLITKPNFKITTDLIEDDVEDLKKVLNKSGIGAKKMERIECFDISNTSGTNATGSMVVFSNGVKDGSNYRKFKIKTLNSPNDFAMLAEILRRRMKHSEWPIPDLLIVDGGKGQVAIALKVLRNLNLKIPLIGLAKREEIFITSDLREIKLPKSSNALKLIMRIRDEAHRFAISYHRKLRSKNAFN